ncbi:toll-like receptor 6 [Ischnura elegans]|uniref:toll-like receptor 6 n=1 Tax=Ischnura elegans TaxID=197161 RepID=UPI001ED87302|nr:toll-like receptor 6 [Ischnura elegans]
MFGAPKYNSCNARTVHRILYIFVTVIMFMCCPCEISRIESEEGRTNHMGYYCKDEPRCLCFSSSDELCPAIVCEDKILMHRRALMSDSVKYRMECRGETQGDPYHYLSMFLSANFSAKWAKVGVLIVINCTAPPHGQSLLEAESRGNVGGRHGIPLEIVHIICEQATFRLDKQHLAGFGNLRRLRVLCPKLSEVDEDLLSGISRGRLELLQISETQVQNLPERFFMDITNIKHVILSRNKLRAFGRSFLSSLPNITTLILSENEIESMDDDIFLQTHLITTLELQKNFLSQLPTSVCSLRNLQSLNAEYNRICFIPQECLFSLPSLNEVTLSGNRLITLGPASNLYQTERITPSNNLEAIVDVLSVDEMHPNSSSMLEPFGKFGDTAIGTSLMKSLNLSNNALTSLPNEAFFTMQKLDTLDISKNRITYLHQDILSRNEVLDHLDASNNFLTHIPATLMRSNSRLTVLELSYNFIETLALDFFQNSTRLCQIYINNNRIRNLPDKIFKPFLTHTTGCAWPVLDMSSNLLEDIPNLTIPQLTYLSLSENRLTSIKPDMLEHLPHLLEVNLSHNLIHSIQMPIMPLVLNETVLFGKHLTKLEVIDLSSNQLTTFPGITLVVSTLKHLNLWDYTLTTRHVDLSHNRIDLTECHDYMQSVRMVWGCLSPLHRLTGLEVIILSHNNITYIPMEFQHYLPNLRFVDLSHNKIKQLWYGDLLFTEAQKDMDLEMFRRQTFLWDPRSEVKELFFNQFPGSNNLTIDLRHNSIDSVELPDEKIGIVIPDCYVDRQFSRVSLLLGHNPFQCDCRVFKLLQYSLKEIRPVSALERQTGHRLVLPAVIDLQDLHCSKPDSINGKAVAEVDTLGYHWLPMIGLCLNHAGPLPKLGRHKTAVNATEGKAMGAK